MSRKCNGVGTHDQIIHFVNGDKRLIQGVQYVWEQGWVHIVDYLGVEYVVNKNNVNFYERVSRGGEGNANTDSSKLEKTRSNIKKTRSKRNVA